MQEQGVGGPGERVASGSGEDRLGKFVIATRRKGMLDDSAE